MLRVELQRPFSQKTVQLTALSRLRLAQGWDFAPCPRSRRSQSVPNAAISVFLTEDDVPPSNQLETQQLVVHDTKSLVQLGDLQLPEVALPLPDLQMNTANSLLRALRAFCCADPGVLDTTAALVQLPPVHDARSPFTKLPCLSPLGRSRNYR